MKLTKASKCIAIFAIILCISTLFTAFVSAYQADAVHAYGFFPDDSIDCHGWLYVLSRSQTGGNKDVGTAETSVSKRTANITEVYVKYWFQNYNTAVPNDTYECSAAPGQTTTPSFNVTVESYNATRLHGSHRVVYKVSANSNVTWTDATNEVADFSS